MSWYEVQHVSIFTNLQCKGNGQINIRKAPNQEVLKNNVSHNGFYSFTPLKQSIYHMAVGPSFPRNHI